MNINFKSFAIGVFIFLPVISTTVLYPKNVNATTRITFARGSYCGSYSGNFSGGREFVLNLGGGQTFTARNTGGGVQYDISVYGATGQVYGTKVSSDQINYQIPRRGDYYIDIKSSIAYNSVEFCAY
jgi:hypothetical protein